MPSSLNKPSNNSSSLLSFQDWDGRLMNKSRGKKKDHENLVLLCCRKIDGLGFQQNFNTLVLV